MVMFMVEYCVARSISHGSVEALVTFESPVALVAKTLSSSVVMTIFVSLLPALPSPLKLMLTSDFHHIMVIGEIEDYHTDVMLAHW